MPIILAVAVLLCVSVSIIFTTMIKLDSSSSDKQKFKIGIVGDTSESFFGIGIKALETFDSSRFAMEFVETDEDNAKASLQNGELSAYVVIPDDFIDSIIYGEIKKMKYYTTADSVGVSALFEEEVTQVISDILIQSQKGIYGLADAMTDSGNGEDAGERMNELCVEYIGLIINRTVIGNNEIIGVADGQSIQCYFLCSIATLFMFLFGISCTSMYVKRDMSLNRIMSANGENALKQIFCEYSAYFLLMYSVVVTALVSLSAFDGVKSLIPEFEYMGVAEIFILAVRLIPMIAMISAYNFLLFEMSRDIVSGVLLQFVASVSLTYIAGCFYPIHFFPDSVQKISAFLPSGTARSYLSECVVQTPININFIVIVIYFILFAGLTVYIRNCRIKGRRGS